MSRTPLAISCVALALVAGFGGTSGPGPAAPVTVVIHLVRTISPTPTNPIGGSQTTQNYRLTCNPTGGSLPLAGRVCEDIRLYPTTMLDPPFPPAYSVGHICSGDMGGSLEVSVAATVKGQATTSFGDDFGCVQYGPPHDATLIYRAAISGNAAALASLKPGLRCATQRRFLCVHDIFFLTPTIVGGAISAPALARVATAFFQLRDEPGTKRCSIPVGTPANPGSAPTRIIFGRCSLSIQGLDTPASQPTVVLTEEWPVTGHETASHTWRVLLDGPGAPALPPSVLSVTQTGPVPPNRPPLPIPMPQDP